MQEILVDRCAIEISGIDAFRFLQNLTTNDIGKADYCYTYMLNNLGRYSFDFFVFKDSSERFLIDIYAGQAENFLAKLRMYKLRAKLSITTLENDYKIVYSKEIPKFKTIYAKQDPRSSSLGFRSLVPDSQIAHIDSQSKLYLRDKYRLAIPDGRADLIVDKSIPIEYGADELHSINYQKGCYIGQEVIARTKYQGVVRKKIFKITSSQDLSIIPNNSPIVAASNKIGAYCSGLESEGIGLVREEGYIEAKDSGAQVTVEGIEIKLSVPIWR